MKSLEFINNLLGALEIAKSITIKTEDAINNLKLIKRDLEMLEIFKLEMKNNNIIICINNEKEVEE